MDTHEAFARMRRNLIDQQTRRLAEAAGHPVGEATRRAFTEIAEECSPDHIDALVALLGRLRSVVPHHIAARPVVAFIGCGQTPGIQPHRGIAITTDATRYNVHTVFWDPHACRWEGQNGRYGMTWHAARDEMNRRAELETQP